MTRFYSPFLYVDGIPSNLLACLEQLEKAEIKQNIGVYCIVNCGFYEGIQCKTAIDILKNWSDKLGLSWGMGIGFGGGGGLAYMGKYPVGKDPKVSLGKSLGFMSERILHRESAENKFISINFPRFLYKFGAESGWRQVMKENGIKHV